MAKKKPAVEEVKADHDIEMEAMLNMDARPMIEMRLAIVRKFREKQLNMIDNNIKYAEDADNLELVKELKAKRQKWRDVTEFYKGLLAQAGPLKIQQGDPLLCLEWDIFDISKAINGDLTVQG